MNKWISLNYLNLLIFFRVKYCYSSLIKLVVTTYLILNKHIKQKKNFLLAWQKSNSWPPRGVRWFTLTKSNGGIKQ
jgi:hypothetical protein